MLTIQKLTSNVHLVFSDANTPWKCNGLVIRADNGESVFIDCNFRDSELSQLFEFIGTKPIRYYVSHVHVDHVNQAHRIEALDIPVYCPMPEDRYIVNGQLLMEHSGAPCYGLLQEMTSFLFDFAGFRNLSKVIPYTPVDTCVVGNIRIEPIPLPGHSPGHTGFIVRDLTEKNLPVLFSSDMGIEKIGAWYGFKYCDVSAIKNSLLKISSIYGCEDFILTGSHTGAFFTRQNGIFKQVQEKIENSKKRILCLMEEKPFISPDDLVFKGVYYKIASIEKREKTARRLYFFWEGYSIRNLMYDLEKQGCIIASGNDRWSLEKAG